MSANQSSTPLNVKVGTLWKEVDNRFNRIVEVVGFDETTKKVKIRTYKHHVVRLAKLSRFNSKYNGYKKICIHDTDFDGNCPVHPTGCP